MTPLIQVGQRVRWRVDDLVLTGRVVNVRDSFVLVRTRSGEGWLAIDRVIHAWWQ